jgi:hypothetical protein
LLIIIIIIIAVEQPLPSQDARFLVPVVPDFSFNILTPVGLTPVVSEAVLIMWRV